MTTQVDKILIGKRFLFDPADNSLVDQLSNNDLVRLGTNESRALQLLTEEPGAVITRQQLHDYVWRQQGFEVDDSSITQAISTLRKALKDSTKSPQFVKTVPKRGYQIIAQIEVYEPETIPCEESDLAVSHLPQHDTEISTAEDVALQPVELTTLNRSGSTNGKRNRPKWLTGLIVVVSITLPIIAYLTPPKQVAVFEKLFEYEQTKVTMRGSKTHFTRWEGLIASCIDSYIDVHQGELLPEKIIVTDGQNQQIFVNYIHSEQQTRENMTTRLIPQFTEDTVLCK